jgi:hypothetical protein
MTAGTLVSYTLSLMIQGMAGVVLFVAVGFAALLPGS